MGIETAIIGSAVLGAGASMFAGNKQANAVKSAQDAANAQAAADREMMRAAGQEAQGIYSAAGANATAGIEPWRATGQNALYQAADAAGVNGADGNGRATSAFVASPGYQWQRAEGLKAVDRQAAARGGLMGGRAIKSAEAFASGLAASEFDKYYNRLFGLSSGGQAAAGTQANIDMATATGRSNALLGAGTNVAAQGAANTAVNMGAATNQASIYGNTVNNGVGALANGGNNLLYAYGRGWLGGGSGGGGNYTTAPATNVGSNGMLYGGV